MPGLRERLADAAYGLGWSVVCRVPESWAAPAFEAAADIAWRRQGPAIQVLEGNLRRVLGPEATGAELRAVSRESMRNYARYWLEAFRLPVTSKEQILERTDLIGHFGDAIDCLAVGRGVIFALPHMGNWDQAGAWFVSSELDSFTTVQERLRPESLNRRFVAFREGLGMEVLPASGGMVSVFATLSDRLRSGKVICLLTDRDVTGTGTEVEFFGEKARMMGGAAALAERTGAALFPVLLWYEGDQLKVFVGEEMPVPPDGERRQRVTALTQELARIYEAGIRAHPADWHMLQRVFAADLDPERLARAETRAAAQWPDAPEGAGDTGRAGG
jgi:phosphatidylinositol dimannoside acyltransferase